MNNVDKPKGRPQDYDDPAYPDLEWWVKAEESRSENVVAYIIIAFILALVVCVFFVKSCSAEEVDIEKIVRIESSGDPLAYNNRSGARGVAQITPICLRDFNNHHLNKWTAKDLYRPTVNRRIARWYLNVRIPQMLKSRGHAVTTDTVLIAYNLGVAKVGKPLPKETRDYLRKYKEER